MTKSDEFQLVTGAQGRSVRCELIRRSLYENVLGANCSVQDAILFTLDVDSNELVDKLNEVPSFSPTPFDKPNGEPPSDVASVCQP